MSAHGQHNWSVFQRLGKFALVGAFGIVVQLAALQGLTLAGCQYLWATGLAVEAAVLHNFLWHQRFTWRDRGGRRWSETSPRLLRFHLSNGMISILGSLLLMRWLVGELRLNVLIANMITIAACSAGNFLASDRWVFLNVRNTKERGEKQRHPRITVTLVYLALLMAMVMAVHSNCSGDTGHHLSVISLDAKSGKPIKHVSVGLSLRNEKGRQVGLSDAVTSGAGIANFDLADPVPEYIEITYSPFELWSCSNIAFPTAQIFGVGMVARYTCDDGRLKWSATPKPGELIIFSKRITLWERMRREIP